VIGLDLTHIDQVCVIVADLQEAMKRYWGTMGIGPWKVRTSAAPPIRSLYHGRPHHYVARLAMAQAGSIVVELLQPLEGESIYHDFLSEHGEGVHHFGIYVPDLDEALAPFLATKVPVVQSAEGTGLKGDGRFAYLDTGKLLGTVLELIQAPSDRAAPELVYP
jgi:methylmalonyl-CoA/ethylmalonyl-CoA epimerase